jgi:hypothetical protein
VLGLDHVDCSSPDLWRDGAAEHARMPTPTPVPADDVIWQLSFRSR